MARGILARPFYARPAEAVARALIGAHLVSTVDGLEAAGRIVETEAYVGPHDDASHAAARIGRTARNAAMFGQPGTAYVYRSYGIHWCLNVVTDRVDYGAAVLIRAIEPVRGESIMRERRDVAVALTRLASGPGNLTRALGITGALDGHVLNRKPLVITRGNPVASRDIENGPRVGISQAVDLPLRFWDRNSPSVSRGPRRSSGSRS